MSVKFSEVCAGDRLIADGGFTCIEEGRVCEVKAGPKGDLYVDCCGPECDFRKGIEGQDDPKGFNYTEQHLLIGQEDDDGSLIGFEKAPV